MDYQDSTLGLPVPQFDNCPAYFKRQAERIWWLWNEGKDQQIADDDAYLQLQYWKEYEGLEQALGEQATRNFGYWYTKHNPTQPETLRRARQFLTEHRYITESSEAHNRRKKKQAMIESQLGGNQ